MGHVKAQRIEEQERGWASINSKFACLQCFEDADIRKFIRKNASEHECSYCDVSSTDEAIAADMNEIIRLIMDGIRLEWGDPSDEGMPWEYREGGWLGEVFDTDELFEKLGFNTTNDTVYSDICGAIHIKQWCQRHLYGQLPQEELFSDWKYFCKVVTHKTRFFFKTEGDSEQLYGRQEPPPPHLILDTLGKMVQRIELITTISPDTEFFRARVNSKGKVHSTIGDLGPPPLNKTCSNRMSPAGISVFYYSSDKQTALQEISHGAQYPAVATVGTFVTLKELKVLDLTKVPPAPGLFDRAKHEIRPACIFLGAFVDDLSKPVDKDGREHIDYVPSQVVMEYFRHIFRDDDGQPIQGILYPSAVKTGGTSCVFFFGPVSDQEYFADKNAIDQWMDLMEQMDKETLQWKRSHSSDGIHDFWQQLSG